MPAAKDGMKFCSGCKQQFPATTEYFYSHKTHKDGFRSRCKICQRKELAIYEKTHPEVRKRSELRYREKNREVLRERERQPERKAVRTLWVDKNRAYIYQRQKDRRSVLRAEMLHAYGWQCACCGETEERFLTLEHTRRDGAIHKRTVGTGVAVWRDLRKRGWPQDGSYTLLCWNCNCATANGEPCPHVLQKKAVA
jgi:hypothetical protein